MHRSANCFVRRFSSASSMTLPRSSIQNHQSKIQNSLHLARVALHRFFPELEVLQVEARATRDAGQRILPQLGVQPRSVADDGRQTAKERTAAGHRDAVVNEAGGEFGLR